MPLVPMMDLVRPALAGGYAVPSFCAWNAEVILAILRVSARMRAPVVLMSGPGEFPLLPPGETAAVSRAWRRVSPCPWQSISITAARWRKCGVLLRRATPR